MMWNEYLNILRGAEVWGAVNFAIPWTGMTVEALTDRDGKQENMIAVKEEMARQEFFPPNEYDQYFELPPARQAHQSVTEQAVERALFSQSVFKDPDLDKLSFGAIRLLWKWDKERIVEIVKAAVWTDRHSAVLMRVNGVVIRKPG
jgi:hypothetical protein